MPVAVLRGALIVLEGVDKSGKSTQCAKLVDALKADGIKAELFQFPARETLTGQLLDQYLQRKCDLEDHAAHLIFSANRWEQAPKMLKLLQEGVTLIVDRYSFSGVAYSAAKKDMDLKWCKQPEVGLAKPDLVIYLTLPAESAAERESYGEERYEDVSMQKSTAEIYQKISTSEWKMISANKSIEKLHEELKQIVKETIKDSCSREIDRLWVDEDL